jgi:hypothetical protein
VTFAVTQLLNKQLGQVLAGIFPGESANPRDPFINPLVRRPGPVALAVTRAWSGETLLEDSQPFADRARQADADVRAHPSPDSTHIPHGREPLEGRRRGDAAADLARPKPGP